MKRVEWIIAGVLVLASSALLAPRARTMWMESQRAEVPVLVDQIRTAALQGTLRQSFDAMPDAHPSVMPREWPMSERPSGIDWPTTHVVGSYSFRGTSSEFVVEGRVDHDGDGSVAIYKASHRQPAQALTPPDVF